MERCWQSCDFTAVYIVRTIFLLECKEVLFTTCGTSMPPPQIKIPKRCTTFFTTVACMDLRPVQFRPPGQTCSAVVYTRSHAHARARAHSYTHMSRATLKCPFPGEKMDFYHSDELPGVLGCRFLKNSSELEGAKYALRPRFGGGRCFNQLGTVIFFLHRGAHALVYGSS